MTALDIESLPINITYACETTCADWQCDQWRVTLTGKSGYWSTNYFTGIGLRNKRTKQPIKPSKIDVLYCLFNDANAAEYNFSDWCVEYGYSDDSIKAMNTYKQCLDIASALRRFFSSEQREAIKAAVSEM